MYPVSVEFQTEVVSGHQVCEIRATALAAGVHVDVPIVAGSVTIDGRREGALRSLSLTVSPDDAAWEALSVLGCEIFVERGLVLSTKTERVPLGVFLIDSDIERADDGTISLSGSDRSLRISRARWTDPYAIAATTDWRSAIEAILVSRWPSCEIGWSGAIGVTLGQALVLEAGESSDPWKDARSIAEAFGYDLYFDAIGKAQLRQIPDPISATPDAIYQSGDLSIVVENALRQVISSTYNGVIAVGEGSDSDVPVRGEAWDEDPASPTYRWGPFGQVPSFYSSPLLTTQDLADAAALSLLAKRRGRAQQVAWSLIVNPAHEAFDVIGFYGDSGLETFMLDSVTIPLTVAEPMSALARETRVG